jgi:hypothetical protein
MEPQRFSIGNVLAVAWQGIERHWLVLFVACAAAGIAATMLAIAVMELLPQFTSVSLLRPLILELVQISLAMLVITPALVLLLRSQATQDVKLRDLVAISARRVVVIIVCQAAIDFIVVAPVYFFGLPLIAVVTIYLVYEVPLLAFNYILLPTVAAEAGGPLKAMRQAFRLLAGRWWRMFAITLILWAASMIVIMVLQYVGLAFGLLLGADTVAILSLCLRLFMMVPISAAAYHLLSREKDGVPPEQAAHVFD